MIWDYGFLYDWFVFSFSPYVAPIALGLLSFGVHYSLHKLHLTRPPGNFFFLMLASMAICTPFEWNTIAEKVGYIAMGVILTCAIGLVYSLITLKKSEGTISKPQITSGFTNLIESMTFGIVMAVSLGVAFLLKIENPYWIPISCLAVMQGSTTRHIWMRGAQRITGTLFGLGLTWLIVLGNPTPLFMVIAITLLQTIVEFLIVRNYGGAVIFITILTVFLSESGKELTADTNAIFLARMIDIFIGSIIGITGGWILYHEKIHFYTRLQVRKSRMLMKKRRRG